MKDFLVRWRRRLGVRTWQGHLSYFRGWVAWRLGKPVEALREDEFEVEGERMLTLARGSREQQYALLDNLEDYVDSRDWTKTSKSTCLSHCRSFFLHNRAALPTDRFIIRSSRPSCSRKLTIDHLRKIVNALLDKPRDRSMILCAWYGFMGSGELEYVNLHGWPQIREQIEKGVTPIRVDLPLGRKNQESFYTMLGKHAVEALQQYIKLERGEIKEGESIWIGKASPVSRRAYADNWRDLTRKLGFLPRRRGDRKSIRYGFNPHNIRDVAKSLVHRAKEKEHEDIMPGVKLLFDMDCVEFWMGHPAKIDPNKYDQFYEDIEYVRRQYRIAEKYLNILIEGEPSTPNPEERKKVQQLEERLARMENAFAAISGDLKQAIEKT